MKTFFTVMWVITMLCGMASLFVGFILITEEDWTGYFGAGMLGLGVLFLLIAPFTVLVEQRLSAIASHLESADRRARAAAKRT